MSSADSRRRISVLPPNLPPRGLSREEAGAYVGVSASLFDRLVKDGIMPKPVHVYGRRVWDRAQLDLAFSALSDLSIVADDPWGSASP